MRLLVTGGTGFIGSNVVRRALARGDRVAVLCRSDEGRVPAGAEVFSGSMEAPPWRIIRDFRPDAIVHAAWIATPGVYMTSPMNRKHLEWSETFLTELLALAPSTVTVLSTCAEYQWGPKPLREDSPLLPDSPYAEAKIELHRRVVPRYLEMGIPLSWARVFYPYGVGEPPSKLSSAMASRLLAGETVAIRTPSARKDFIQVDDLARAILCVVDSAARGPINLGTGVGVSILDFVRTIAAVAGIEAERVEIAPDAVDAPDTVADVSRLSKLSFEHRVGLESGLAELVAALRSHTGLNDLLQG